MHDLGAVVLREQYTFEGASILTKIEPVLSGARNSHSFSEHFSQGLRPVQEYGFSGEVLECDGQKYQLSSKEQHDIRFKLRQVEILDYLAQQDTPERFVRRVFCRDTGKNAELFYLDDTLYLRTLMKEKKGVCLDDKNKRYVTPHESDMGLIHPLDTVKLAKDMCENLQLLEKWGILHRDVKRGNILRKAKEAGKSIFSLVDFGTACRVDDTRDVGLAIGTAGYLAPEVIWGNQSRVYADRWSLGAVLYAEITGELPFSGIVRKQIGDTDIAFVYQKMIDNSAFQMQFVEAVAQLLQGDIEKRDLNSLLAISTDILDGKISCYRPKEKSVKKIDFAATRQEPLVGGLSTSARSDSANRLVRIRETFEAGDDVANAIAARLGSERENQ